MQQYRVRNRFCGTQRGLINGKTLVLQFSARVQSCQFNSPSKSCIMQKWFCKLLRVSMALAIRFAELAYPRTGDTSSKASWFSQAVLYLQFDIQQ